MDGSLVVVLLDRSGWGSGARLLLGGVLLGVAVWLDRRSAGAPIKVGDLRNPLAGSANPLDRWAYRVPDARAAARADAGLYGAPTLPLLLALHPRARHNQPCLADAPVLDYPRLLLIWLEAILLTFALTSVIKNLANRPRPYVLHPEFPAHFFLTRKDRAAFLSGHAALAATGAMLFYHFGLRVAHSRVERALYAATAIMFPITTAFLRARAAKHWPTDVVAGLILGSVTSKLVIKLGDDEGAGKSG